MNKRYALALMIGYVAAAGAGCQMMNHTQSGAVVGSGLGALTGAVIGGESGHAPGGALIGAAIGGLAGGTIGHSEDIREEHEASILQAHYMQQSRNALTNLDLVRLAQSGISEEVIVSAIQTRGGRFDLSPDALIQLKANGVTDRVILAMQRGGGGDIEPAEPPVNVIVAPPPGPFGPPPVFVPGPPPPHWWFH
jgi:hypothetical protein